MLTLGTGPEPVAPLAADHWLTRLEDLHVRIINAVTALDALDPDVPMLSMIAADAEARRAAYFAIYSAECKAAAHLETMIVQAEQRAADHEATVREALASGASLPVAGDVELVARVIAEQQRARDAAYPEVEQVGQAYQKACTVGAASRAFLLRLQLEPARLEAEKVLENVRAVDGRIDIARSSIDAPTLERAFRDGGLL